MARKWNNEFTASSNKICVNIFRNGDFENGKTLHLEPDWTFQDFLNAASKRLELESTARRIFSIDGIEIDDCMMMEDDDIVFLSPDERAIFINTTVGDSSEGGDTSISSSVGSYKVSKFLGKGGFGEVRIGEHQLTGERVALKFLRKADISTINAAERTTVEIQCLSALKHSNIIRLQQHIDTPSHVVLVFELMEGGDFHKYLSSRGSTSKEMAISEEDARPVFHQLLSAISYAHNQHICHRDLKLENILLKDKSLSVVKIADFGLSDFYRPGSMMKSNCGTLSFLAPEVFRGTSNAGPPLDVWSLGVILFAILCGRLPFEGNDQGGRKRSREANIRSQIMKCQFKIDDSISPEAKDLVRRMLKLDPQERASIPELLGHCWLRSAVGIDFETKRKNSYTGGEAGASVDNKSIGSTRSKENETTPISSSSSSDARKMKILTSESEDLPLDAISELILESPCRSAPSPRSQFIVDQPDTDTFDDLMFSTSPVSTSNVTEPSPTFKLVPLRRSKSGTLLNESPSSNPSLLSPSLDALNRSIATKSQGSLISLGVSPKSPGDSDSYGNESSSPVISRRTFLQNGTGATSATISDRRTGGSTRQSALQGAGAFSLRSHRVSVDNSSGGGTYGGDK